MKRLKLRLQLKIILAPLLSLILSSALFIFLYHTDNKYTSEAAQAANGLLVLSEKDLQNHPLRYLTYGWEFYPGVLLTPDDLNDMPRYMVYTMIGERTRFDFGGGNPLSDDPLSGDPHGSASYAMELQLPHTVRTYALELPEIFSAYRLYINGEPVLTMGNPDTAYYTPRTASRVVTFESSGRTSVLLAVSDYSHFYSGLVYPPAFGTPEAVNAARDLRLWLRVAALSVAVIAALCALFLGLRMKERNALLFTLLCLAVCGYISYPIIHSAFVLPVFPWYALELFCGYAVTLLVVILHNRLCDMQRTTRLVSTGAAVSVCAAALIYGLVSPHLTVAVMFGFSVLVFIFKAATALYLLHTSATGLKTKPEQGWALFCAALVYAAAFVWDRFLPFYEPVIGGWFPEIGSIVLVTAVGYSLWRNFADAYTAGLALTEEHRHVSRQLTMQLEYSGRLAEKAEENRRLVHDFRQHLRTIDALAQESGNRSVREYLGMVEQLIDSDDYTHGVSFCENAAADALLGYYYCAAMKQGIEMTVRLVLPEKLPLTDVELCTVLGNLLENALDACGRQTHGRRNIVVSSVINGASLFLLVENSYDGIVRMQGGQLLSRKANDGRLRFGIGLRSVREIVERHGGELDIFPLETVFRAGVCIPLCRICT